MASDPRSVFSRYALAALSRARAQFEADRWALGIEAASAQSLRASLDQAIAATAKRASVSQQTVHKLVPGEQVASILADLAARHTEALQTARRYASSFTGLLSRSLHIEDSSAPAYLRGLAARHHDDEFICAPLTAFAEQLARWQQLMELIAKEIGSNRALTTSFQLRRLVRAALAVGTGFVLSVVVAAVAWWWLVAEASRKRLDAAVSKPDPCGDETVTAQDRKHARPPQIEAFKTRAEQCLLLRRRQEYVARCTALADHVQSAQMTPEDDVTAGATAALVRRVASAGLTLTDLTIDDGAMPCQDTEAGLRLWNAFGHAAGKAESLWGQAESLSPKVLGLLSHKPFALSAESQAQLSSRADGLARKSVVTGRPAELAHARALCDLQVKLGVEPLGRGCKALFRLAAGR